MRIDLNELLKSAYPGIDDAELKRLRCRLTALVDICTWCADIANTAVMDINDTMRIKKNCMVELGHDGIGKQMKVFKQELTRLKQMTSNASVSMYRGADEEVTAGASWSDFFYQIFRVCLDRVHTEEDVLKIYDTLNRLKSGGLFPELEEKR